MKVWFTDMKKNKTACTVLAILTLIFATSCESSLKITLTTDLPRFSYSGSLGDAFYSTISTVMGLGEAASDDFLDAEDIKNGLSQSGFTNVSAKNTQKNSFSVDFSPSKEGDDPVSLSGILKYDAYKKPYLEFSKEKFQSLYSLVPFEIQSHLDMFMAPSFTGEEMSDEEYLDLLASVYGQKLSDEIKKSKINFVFVQEKSESKMSLSLLSILNTTGTLVVRN